MDLVQEHKKTIMGTAAALASVGVAYWLYRSAVDEDDSDDDTPGAVGFDELLEDLQPI